MSELWKGHGAFVTAWREYGERWLFDDNELMGSTNAWFKVCTGRLWWDDNRLPPGCPVVPVRYKPPKRRRAAPRKKVTVAKLTRIGKDLFEWSGLQDHSMPARHRDREQEFRSRIERELKQLRRDDEWPLAV